MTSSVPPLVRVIQEVVISYKSDFINFDGLQTRNVLIKRCSSQSGNIFIDGLLSTQKKILIEDSLVKAKIVS